MFIFSVRANKGKVLALGCVLLAAVMLAAYAVNRKGQPAAADSVINYKASTASERLAFISQFGWEVEEDPAEVAEVVIPGEFDEVYTSYNEIQKSGGMDLEPYRGLRAKRWCYTVLNYPGYEQRHDAVEINLLIYEGTVIGGDVCSMEQGGFMQGFDFPEQSAVSTAPAQSEQSGEKQTGQTVTETAVKTYEKETHGAV